MTGNTWVRQTHRWLSIVFTVTVLAGIVAGVLEVAEWVFYLPLLPLALQLFTGLYLFAAPYAARRRGPRET